MKISNLIKALTFIQSEHGDIEVDFVQDLEVPVPENFPIEEIGKYIACPEFFIAEEEYEDGWRVNLRTWPY